MKNHMNVKDTALIEALTTKYGKAGVTTAINRLTEGVNSNATDSPKVYVGTYAKYNNGDLTGEWVDLSDFSDKDDFIEHCLEIHSDEAEPELMFQDYENIPDNMISESDINEDFWEILSYIDGYGYQFIMDVMDARGIDSVSELETYLDNMVVYYTDSVETAVQMYCDDGMMTDDKKFCEQYFDYDSFGRTLKDNGAFDYRYDDVEDADERAEIEDEIDNMSDSEAAEEYIMMCGGLDNAVRKNDLPNYIDYNAFMRDLEYDCTFVESEINGESVVAILFE
jgi:antirestriction protein